MEKYCPKCFKKFSGEVTRCPTDGQKLISMVERDLVGQELDERYKVLSVLGKGGMGVVYVAEQAMIGRKVALKVLRREMVQDDSSVKRFFTEAKAIATLKSPHTITLHDFGITQEGLLYYTMELLEGVPLSKIISREGPLAYERATKIIFQALDSLEEAHDKGILHRDIKPENLFVSVRREEEHLTVLDFGIAKLVDDSSIETVTKTGMICGTPAYLAPEQALGNPAVPASDLYSLAIVFYEMLAGMPPFHETTPMKLLLQHLNNRPEPIHVVNPDVQVPTSIDAFLQRALEKLPENRFATVPVFRKALQGALDLHQAHPETARLIPIGSTAQGVRTIPETMVQQVMDEATITDPGDIPGVHDTPEQSRAAGGKVAPSADTGRVVSRRSKWAAGIALVVVAGLGIGVWQPWKTASSGSGGTAGDGAAVESAAGAGGTSDAALDGAVGSGPQALPPAGGVAGATAQEAQLASELQAARKAAAEARAVAEQQVRLNSEQSQRAQVELEAKLRAEQDEKARAELEVRLKAEMEARLKAEEELRLKAEAEAKAKAELEARQAAELAAKLEAEKEAKLKAGQGGKSGSGTKSGKSGPDSKTTKGTSADGKAEGKPAGDFGFRPVEVEKKPSDAPKEEKGFGFRPVEVE